MNERPTIREQIDACRPGSDDLHLPEHAADLAELSAGLRENGPVRADWERHQLEGRVVRNAMHDVSLPARLEARLLAAVRAAQNAPLAGVEQTLRTDSAAENPVALPPPDPSRRGLLKVAVGIASIAALVLFGFLFRQSFQTNEQPITTDQLATQAQEWLDAVNPHAMKGTKSIPATYPGGVVLGRVESMGTISAKQGTITAYRVKNPANSAIATVLVIPTTQVYPVGKLPLSNIPGVSGGWQVKAWQQGGILYVIAVPENSDARLDQFIRQQPIG